MQVYYFKLMCEIVTFDNDLCFHLRPRSHVMVEGYNFGFDSIFV